MRGSRRELRAGLWKPRVYLGGDSETGKGHQVSRTFHGGARAAAAALRDLVDRRTPGRTNGIGVTVGHLLDRSLAECERRDLSSTTIRDYRSQVNGTIRLRLGKLKPPPAHSEARRLHGVLKDAGKSPQNVCNVHAVLSTALHQGVRWGWVRENIDDRAKPPRGDGSRRGRRPSGHRRGRTEDPRLAPLLMLPALTGMRRGSCVPYAGPTSTLRSVHLTFAGPSSWRRADSPRRAPRPIALGRSRANRSALPSSPGTGSRSRSGLPMQEKRLPTTRSSSRHSSRQRHPSVRTT